MDRAACLGAGGQENKVQEGRESKAERVSGKEAERRQEAISGLSSRVWNPPDER
jgi:hypothetical protein